MAETSKFFTLSGTSFYAKVHKPEYNEFSQASEYSLQLVVDKETLKFLKEKQVQIHEQNKNIPHEHVTLKSRFKPPVLDSQNNPISPEILIGNVSKINVKASTFPGKIVGSKRLNSLGLQGVQVTELVPYEKPQLFAKTDRFVGAAQDASDAGDIF